MVGARRRGTWGPDSRRVCCAFSFPTQALFPDLGGALGTLVFESPDTLDAPTWDALIDQGFATSAFSAPLPDEEFDIGSFAEMFAEWGWTSDDKPKPPWMD